MNCECSSKIARFASWTVREGVEGQIPQLYGILGTWKSGQLGTTAVSLFPERASHAPSPLRHPFNFFSIVSRRHQLLGDSKAKLPYGVSALTYRQTSGRCRLHSHVFGFFSTNRFQSRGVDMRHVPVLSYPCLCVASLAWDFYRFFFFSVSFSLALSSGGFACPRARSTHSAPADAKGH